MQTNDSNPSHIVLNGRPASLEGVAPYTTLLDFLRSQGLTGAKEGCAEGECGACTVIAVGGDERSSEYRTVNSCLMLAQMAAGYEIYTVESLAQNRKLSEAQAAMAAGGGSQCGYCTPGFVMSLFAEQYRRDRTGPCDPHEMSGNLCRCTGYRPIRDAALSLGAPPPGVFLDRLSRPAPRIGPWSYSQSGFRFSRPESLSECLAILARDSEARLISGGTDLMVESNLRRKRWPHLVSTEAIAELKEFRETDDSVRIGAGLPLRDIARSWKQPPECFTQWLPLFASSPLRNRATLGGNLATASPIGDAAPMLMALDAILHLASGERSRAVPIAAFFRDYRRTILDAGEMIAGIEIPKPYPEVTQFYKVAKRRMDDISTVAAGISLRLDQHGVILQARFAYGGVAAVPLRVVSAEAAAEGNRWSRAIAERVRDAVEQELRPMSDHRGSAAFRKVVAGSLVEKLWWEREEMA